MESIDNSNINSTTISTDGTMDVLCSEKQPAAEPINDPVKRAHAVTGIAYVKQNLLERVAESDGHFKHQQRSEPDLSFGEKFEIANKLLEEKPTVFLTRYGRFLIEEDLIFFEAFKEDYTIQFHLKEICKSLDDRKNLTKIKNRRFEAVKKLMDEGEYFSDESTKARDPLLYEQMIGQYMTMEEAQAASARADITLSGLLLNHLQSIQNNELYEKQKDIEESQFEEGDSDEEEVENEEDVEEEDMEDGDEMSAEGQLKIGELPSAEKLMLREEFIKMMQLRFIAGEDVDFDYSQVDNNVEYDSLDIRERDEEEKYFDEEEPEEALDAMSQDSDGAPFKPLPALPVQSGEAEDYEPYQVEDQALKLQADMQNVQINSDSVLAGEQDGSSSKEPS